MQLFIQSRYDVESQKMVEAQPPGALQLSAKGMHLG